MLLVYKIHSLNFLLFWFLSFFFEIIAYELNPFMGRFRSKRIKLLEWDKYFSADEIICYRSEALKVWEKILLKFPTKPWKFNYDNHIIDFSKKAKQEMGACFEHLFLFREIQKKAQTKSNIYIVNSREFAYISRIAGPELFSCKTAFTISKMNVLSDALLHYFDLVARFASIFYLTVKMLLKKYPSQERLQPPVKYLWDAVNPNEMLHLSPEKRYFPWIIDGNHITHKDIVFLIPAAGDKVMQEIKASPYQAFTITSLYRIIPKDIIWKSFKSLLSLTPGLFLFSLLKYENIAKAHYAYSILLYKPLTLYLKPACYITSMSSTGNENPAVEYFNVINIKTLMYSYSANAHLCVNDSYKTDFRNIPNAYIISSHVLVWHEQFKKFIQEHPQERLEVKVIGPLMAGDEKALQDVNTLRRIYISKGKTRKENATRYISVFDEASATKQWKLQNITHDLYPNLYNDEYCTAFMKDMYGLLTDFDSIVLLYKPQRSLVKKKFSYSPEFREIVEKITNNGRGIILDDDINPWVPIALSDLCIGIPFTSPVMAAMHYGKPALYHDPAGIARHHRYESISQYITHNYIQLRSRVRELLDLIDSGVKNEDLWLPAKAGFAGSHPGENSSDEFRKYLSHLSST